MKVKKEKSVTTNKIPRYKPAKYFFLLWGTAIISRRCVGDIPN